MNGESSNTSLSTTQGDRFAVEGPGFGRERAFGFSSSHTASNARKRLGKKHLKNNAVSSSLY